MTNQADKLRYWTSQPAGQAEPMRSDLLAAAVQIDRLTRARDALRAVYEWRTRADNNTFPLELLEEIGMILSESPLATKTQSWNTSLRREVAAQKALIERMDYPPNHEMGDNGIMGQIRQERLEALEKLLEFEPENLRGSLPDEPSEKRCDGCGEYESRCVCDGYEGMGNAENRNGD